MAPRGSEADGGEPGSMDDYGIWSFSPACSEDDGSQQKSGSMLRWSASVISSAAIAASDEMVSKVSKVSGKRSFIKKSKTKEEMEKLAHISDPVRKAARQFVLHAYYDCVSGFVVFVDFIAICQDTDCKASADCTNIVASTVMMCCFVFYVFDLLLRLCADGLSVFKQRTHVLDAFVICVSIFELSMDAMQQATSSVTMIRMVRLCRLLRLVRVVKLFASMKELRRLVQMIATCGRTMFWSFLMAFLVMTMWAVAAVELVHPVAQKLADEGTWPECERCGRAFETVMSVNLTFFQTVLAGDSWGIYAMPIIEEAPATAIVLCGALLSLSFGIMQLITAVVVDTFADLRKMDVNGLAEELEAEEKHEKKFLFQMFAAIDSDSSGRVTYEELSSGAFTVKDFQDWLRVMDIDEADLGRLFRMIDNDRSGSIELAEFIDVLYRLRNAEEKTTGKMVKHMLDNLEQVTSSLVLRIDALHTFCTSRDRPDTSRPGTPRPGTPRPGTPSTMQESPRSLIPEGVAPEPIPPESMAPLQRACVVALEAALAASVEKIQMGLLWDSDRTFKEPHAGFFETCKKIGPLHASENGSPTLPVPKTLPLHGTGNIQQTANAELVTSNGTGVCKGSSDEPTHSGHQDDELPPTSE
eukprot:TRINITY_DN10303_c0_g1_i4.p1 TRINITY_DN10303_c0_g1~~TRINITY_DN10303_c0_g1_i4.p1  ORF type:complete len:641 (+),score=119.96 TRINITY_DN10303_c0_g1_i4:223-2145(+)